MRVPGASLALVALAFSTTDARAQLDSDQSVPVPQ